MPFVQMSGGNGLPVLGKRIGRGFALHPGYGFLDFVNRLTPPDGKLRGVQPFLPEQTFLRDLQAVASERRRF